MSICSKEIYEPKSDPIFAEPYVDVDEQRIRKDLEGKEVVFRYIHGGFRGTNVKFSYSFPKKEFYQERFYHYMSPAPGPDEEIISQMRESVGDQIVFALTHGAYFVESNMGVGTTASQHNDPTMFYRSSAAVAEYSREIAKQIYGEHRPYGYIYGGSGGGYKTMSCIENATAWDGALPYVIGSTAALPNSMTIYSHARRVLRNAYPKIVTALDSGRSSDIYEGLNEEEAEALREMIQMGISPEICYSFGDNNDGALVILAPVIRMMDPEYFTDYWTKPGYLGTAEKSSAVRDRILLKAKVVSVGIPAGTINTAENESRNGADDSWHKILTDRNQAYLELEQVPTGNDRYLCGTDIIVNSGEAKDARLCLEAVEGNRIIIGRSFAEENPGMIIRKIKPGDEVTLDNSDYLAAQTYHRHQVTEDNSFICFNQFLDESGEPIYPQRPQVISYNFAYGGCGSIQDGQIQGKVIVMCSLIDAAFPWQGDWYRRRVEAFKGEEADQYFRLWFNENCPHGDYVVMDDELRVTGYLGALYQGLLDLSNWVEKDIQPPANTNYKIEDSQVILADNAKERKGIQPVISLQANGKRCAKVKVGETVEFEAFIAVPENAGQCTRVEWSFQGEQDYPVKSNNITVEEIMGISHSVMKQSHIYTEPGTYLTVVRVKSNRKEHLKDKFTEVGNICRARIIVE